MAEQIAVVTVSVPVLGAPGTVSENEEAFNQFGDMLPSLSMEYS